MHITLLILYMELCNNIDTKERTKHTVNERESGKNASRENRKEKTITTTHKKSVIKKL